MRILQISRVFVPSSFAGIKTAVYGLSKELVKRGHDVTVYTSNAYDYKSNTDRVGAYDVDGINVVYFKNYFPRRYFFTPGMIQRMKRELQEYDVVHMHDTRTFQNLVSYYYCRKYGTPYVISAHGTLPYIVEKILLKKIHDYLIGYRIIRDASRLIAISPTEAEQYREIGVNEDRIVEIPNAVNVDDFEELPEKGTFRERYNLKDGNIVLYVGRIHKIKGLDILIRAYSELLKEKKDLKLVIAGNDFGYLGKLKELVNKLKIKDKVIFPGFISGQTKLAAYVDADVLVLPSEKEVFGIVVAEAAMCGTPSIVTKGCEVSDIIKKENFGLVVKQGAVHELKDAMMLLLEDKKLSKIMGENGRRYVLDNWTWDKVGAKVERVYREITQA
jgi:glycosyltransferase involved in cell wall biosynthesis